VSREPTALLLAAFLVTFVLTRTYTRLARARGWGSASANGIHLHHMVVGIVFILLSGLVEIASRPSGLGRDAIAIAFGVGAAFTLDEFALWLYLRDVYWSEEGHRSVDASVIGVLLAALLLVGGCGASRLEPGTLAEGTWGGEEAGLIVRADGAHAHIGCTYGDVAGPIPFDADGRFDVAAQWNVQAFPIDRGVFHPARLSGRTKGRTLTFSARLTDTGQELGPVSVTLGREPRMANCPICRSPR